MVVGWGGGREEGKLAVRARCRVREGRGGGVASARRVKRQVHGAVGGPKLEWVA